MKNMHKEYYTAYFDGSATPNPGKMNIGGYIKDDRGRVVFQFSEFVGNGTNNVAEYLACKKICEKLVEMNAAGAQIIGDSELVVKQLNGEYKVKKYELKKLHQEILALLKKIDECFICWVPRTQNKQADELSKPLK